MVPAYDYSCDVCILIILRVNTRISAEVTKPFEDRKFDGIFTITTELNPLASPAFEIGRYVGF
jgi:exosome complex RNA-binding protein Rrp42 (RNase PH superfamily)